ncbi:hypothetical protein JCM3774_006009 [Rhodotorula dairenensis]
MAMHAGKTLSSGNWTVAKRDADGRLRVYGNNNVSRHPSYAAAIAHAQAVPTVLIYQRGVDPAEDLPDQIPEVEPGTTVPPVVLAIDLLGKQAKAASNGDKGKRGNSDSGKGKHSNGDKGDERGNEGERGHG